MAQQQHSSSAAASGRGAFEDQGEAEGLPPGLSYAEDGVTIVRGAPELQLVPPSSPANPDDYIWRPIARRPRRDGWSPDKQRKFIEALAETGVVERAAERVGLSVSSAYRLRASADAEGFRAAWTVALQHAAQRVLDLAFTRAIEGTEEPVFDRDGCRVATRWRANDRLTMFILRAYMPERFRDAHRSTRDPAEPLPPPPVDLDAAIEGIVARPADVPATREADELPELYRDAELLAEEGPPQEAWRPAPIVNTPLATARASERRQAEQQKRNRRQRRADEAQARAGEKKHREFIKFCEDEMRRAERAMR